MAIDTIGTNAIANDAVTAAKIPAGAVTSDIADGSITSAKLASGVAAANLGTGEITTSMIADDAVTSTKVDSTVSLTSDIVSDVWYLTSDVSHGTDPTKLLVGTMWTQDSQAPLASNHGGSMSVHNTNGEWTFPSTGIWRVNFNAIIQADGSDTHVYTRLDTTLNDGSNWTAMRYGSHFHTAVSQNSGRVVQVTLDITDTTNQKIRLQTGSATGCTVRGSRVYTYVEFLRLAGT